MGRLWGVALLALAGAGCTSVKMVQRDGCWVRRTENSFGKVVEEVGPCGRPKPEWAQDRLTRLVQECMAQADWRWTSRQLEVWSRRLPYATPQPREETLLRACMDEARTGMVTEQDAKAQQSRISDLSGRLAELSGERDALRGDAAREHAKLQERDDKLAEWLGKSHEKLSDWLGQAAQKPPGAATATATSSSTSDGKATTENESGATLASESGASSPPAAAPVSSASVVLPPGTAQAPAPAQPAQPAQPQKAQKATRRTKRARAKPLIRPAAGDCAPAVPDAPRTASSVAPPVTPAGPVTPASSGAPPVAPAGPGAAPPPP